MILFSTKTRGRKAFAAEQKIRDLKQSLLKSKRMEKDQARDLNRMS